MHTSEGLAFETIQVSKWAEATASKRRDAWAALLLVLEKAVSCTLWDPQLVQVKAMLKKAVGLKYKVSESLGHTQVAEGGRVYFLIWS